MVGEEWFIKSVVNPTFPRVQVLFFDESLDEAEGKPISFLSDTSQNHSAKHRIVVQAVNRQGFEAQQR